MNASPSSDIFEMILESVEDPVSIAQAKPASFTEPNDAPDWHEEHQEGQLAVDVIETKDDLVVVSTVAGAITEKLEVYVHGDLLTIRGIRTRPVGMSIHNEYHHEECFWGKFSRTVVLPLDVKGDLAHAEYKNGVLTIHIPKKKPHKPIPVIVVDE